MSNSKHTESAYKTRNNIAGKGHKGLVNQSRTYEQNQEDDEASEIGQENVLLDRWLNTKVNTPEARVAKAALDKFKTGEVA